jgi:hypothetical protein
MTAGPKNGDSPKAWLIGKQKGTTYNARWLCKHGSHPTPDPPLSPTLQAS